VNATYDGRSRVTLGKASKRVTTVPAFFINGEMFNGKPTFDNLSKGLKPALKKAKKKEKTFVRLPKV
jgi:hypothetical protein